MRKLSATVLGLLVLAGTTARADGLLYQLPENGAWVKFDLEMEMERGEVKQEGGGSLRMSSVGMSVEGDKKCRWIEFRLDFKAGERKRTIVAKALVPESELKEGKDPLANRVRGWIKMQDRDVVELTDDKLGPMSAFMAPALTDVKELEPSAVESKLGKLSCAGLTGQTTFKEGSATNAVKLETRRHAKAPFGVVTSKMAIEILRDGEVTGAAKMNFTLSDFGDGAKSELADNN